MNTWVDTKSKVTLKDYVRILFKRKDLIVIPILSVFFLSMIGSFFMPKAYRATTIIKIESRTPDLNPLDRNDAEKSQYFLADLLKTFREELLSWGLLSEVLNHPDIDMLKAAGKDMKAQEKIVEDVRKNILTAVRGLDVITITYEGKDAEKVYKIVDKLSGRYIERSLDKQTSIYQSTMDFLQKRLRDAEDERNATQAKLKKFKENNFLDLPGEGSSARAKLGEAQSAFVQVQLVVDQSEKDLALIDKQLSGEEPVVITETTREMNPVISDLKLKIHELEVRLNNLLLMYTDKHPDVIETRRAIETIQKQMASEEVLLTSNERSENNPIYQTLKLKKQEIEQQLNNLHTRRDQIQKLVEDYQAKIRSFPTIEQEYNALERAYKEAEETFSTLKRQVEGKVLSQQIELAEQGIRFNRIEPPRMPQVPFKPNRVKIGILGLGMGIFLAGFLVILAEYSDHSFRSYADASESLNIPILGTVASIRTEADIYRAKQSTQKKYLWTFASFVVILIIAIPVILLVGK